MFRFLKRLSLWREAYKQAKKKRKKPTASNAEALPQAKEPHQQQGSAEQSRGGERGDGYTELEQGQEDGYEALDDGDDDRTAQSSFKPRKASAASSIESSAVTEITRQFGIFAPFSSDLIGSELFRLANIEVPLSSRPHTASRELFLQDIYDNKSPIYAGRRDLVYAGSAFPLSKYGSDIDLHTMISPFCMRQNGSYLLYPRYRADIHFGTYLMELLRASCSVSLSMQPRIRSVRPPLETEPTDRHDENSTNSISGSASVVSATAASDIRRMKRVFSEACAAAAADLEVTPLSPTPPPFDVVVLDVFVDIPMPALKGQETVAAGRRNRRQEVSSDDNEEEEEEEEEGDREKSREGAAAATAAGREQSKSSSVVETVKNTVSKTLFGASSAAKTRKEAAPAPKKLNCSLHYAVGVFPSTLPRPPPSVDMSLMSWDIVRDRGETPETLAAKSGNNRPSAYKRKTEWTTSRSLPGVGMTNKRHPSSGGNIHFRILKNPLPRDNIEEIVPKKFRIWLGLDY